MENGHSKLRQRNSGDLLEIQTSQLLLQRGRNPQLRQFAQQMIDHHTRLSATLMAAARQGGVTPPPPRMLNRHANMLNMLAGEGPEAFELSYLRMQLAAHNEAVLVHARRRHRTQQRARTLPHHIIAHPGRLHSLDALAAVAGMSRASFARRFSEVYQRTPGEVVQEVRLRAAARMLRTCELPVKTVAASVGYSSRSHFSRAFKAAYGVDPTAFRTKLEEERSPKPAEMPRKVLRQQWPK